MTLTKIHALETGTIVSAVHETAPAHGVAEVETLIERKQSGERTPLPASDEARERSPLPAEPPNAAELDAWLIEARRARLTGV